MTGFEYTIHKKMRGISAPAILYAQHDKLDYLGVKKMLTNSFGNIIKNVSGSSVRQAILSRNDHQTVFAIKGIDPEAERLTTSIEKKIIEAQQSLPKLLTKSSIIIGHKIGAAHGINVGDTITILIPEQRTKNKLLLEEHDVKVTGFIKVGLDEYDSNMAYCSLDLFYNLYENEQGVDQLALTFKQDAKITETISWLTKIKNALCSWLPFCGENNEVKIVSHLKSKLPDLQIRSWRELYPALVSSLKLEKYVMALILALITLVASMNIISVFFMQVHAKRGDIAILQAMGMPKKDVRKIFVVMGLFLTISASVLGLLCALAIGMVLQHFPFITLPDIYYVSHLPAHIEFSQFLIVFFITILMGLAATWIPAKLARNVSIAEVLRQE